VSFYQSKAFKPYVHPKEVLNCFCTVVG